MQKVNLHSNTAILDAVQLHKKRLDERTLSERSGTDLEDSKQSESESEEGKDSEQSETESEKDTDNWEGTNNIDLFKTVICLW